jgi:hypothetical protein
MKARILAATLTAGAVLCLGAEAASAEAPGSAAATATPTTAAPAAATPAPAAATPAPVPAAPAAATPAATPTPAPATHHSAGSARSRDSAGSYHPAAPYRPATPYPPATSHGTTRSGAPTSGSGGRTITQSPTPPPPGCKVTATGGVSCADERVCVVTSGTFQCFGGAACGLSSAGLTCPKDVPLCTVANGQLTCAQGCVLTSAGLNCGAVLDLPPVIHRPARKRHPTPPPPPAPAPVVQRFHGTTAGQLPVTGATLVPSILVGSVLLGSGLLLRRRTHPGAPAVSPASEVPAPAPTPGQRPAGADRGVLMPSIVAGWVLLAVGLLARRRRRR